MLIRSTSNTPAANTNYFAGTRLGLTNSTSTFAAFFERMPRAVRRAWQGLSFALQKKLPAEKFRRATNPDGDDLTLFYPGSASDVTAPLAMTDASRLIFADIIDEREMVHGNLLRHIDVLNVSPWTHEGEDISRLIFTHHGRRKELVYHIMNVSQQIPPEILNGYDVLFLKGAYTICFGNDRNFSLITDSLRIGGCAIICKHPGASVKLEKSYGFVRRATSRETITRSAMSHYTLMEKVRSVKPNGTLSAKHLTYQLSEGKFLRRFIGNLRVLMKYQAMRQQSLAAGADPQEDEIGPLVWEKMVEIVTEYEEIYNAIVSLYDNDRMRDAARAVPMPEPETLELIREIFLNYRQGEHYFTTMEKLLDAISEMAR